MKCQFNTEKQHDDPWGKTPGEPCSNEGTHCLNCPCSNFTCFHTEHLVCESHYMFVAGYLQHWAISIGEGTEDEMDEDAWFTKLYDEVGQFLPKENYEQQLPAG